MTVFDSPSEVPSAINDAGLSDVSWVRLRAVD